MSNNVVENFIKDINTNPRHKDSIDRLLGAKVLLSTQKINSSNLKKLKLDKLDQRTLKYGFHKIIDNVYVNSNKKFLSKIIHSNFISFLSFIVNKIILRNVFLTSFLFLSFLTSVIYMSMCLYFAYPFQDAFFYLLLIVNLLIAIMIDIYSSFKKII